MHVIRTPCVKDRLQGKPADPAAEKSTIEPAFPRAFYAQNLCNYTASNIWHVQEKKKSSNARVIWGRTDFGDTRFFILKCWEWVEKEEEKEKKKGEPNDRVRRVNDSSVLCDVRQLTFHFASWKTSILK